MANDNKAPQMNMGGGRRGPGGPHAAMMMEKPRIKNTKKTLLRIISYLGSNKFFLIFVLLLSLVTSVTTILGTRLSGEAIDKFIATKDMSGLLKLCGILGIIYLAGIISTYVS